MEGAAAEMSSGVTEGQAILCIAVERGEVEEALVTAGMQAINIGQQVVNQGIDL